jgi:hypothetical protein
MPRVANFRRLLLVLTFSMEPTDCPADASAAGFDFAFAGAFPAAFPPIGGGILPSAMANAVVAGLRLAMYEPVFDAF